MKIRVYDRLNNTCWIGWLLEDRGEVFVVKNIFASSPVWEYTKEKFWFEPVEDK